MRSNRHRMLLLLLAVVMSVFGAACNENADDPAAATSPPATASPTVDASPATASPSPDAEADHPACEPAQRIADLDDEVTATLTEELNKLLTEIAAGGKPSDAQFEEFLATVQTVVKEKLPELVSAYDDFAAALPANLSEDALILRDFTVNFTEQLARLTPAELENVDKLLQGEDALEAAGATFALDEFTQKECGIVLAD